MFAQFYLEKIVFRQNNDHINTLKAIRNMKTKYKEGDKVWIRIGTKPKQKIIKSITSVNLQSGTNLLFKFGGSIERYSHEIWPNKSGALLK